MVLALIRYILAILEESMTQEHFDNNQISAKNLEISAPLWGRVMKLLVDNDLITGVEIDDEDTYPKAEIYFPEITLKGLEYLHK